MLSLQGYIENGRAVYSAKRDRVVSATTQDVLDPTDRVGRALPDFVLFLMCSETGRRDATQC